MEREKIKELYCNRHTSVLEIGKLLDYNPKTISNILDDMCITKCDWRKLTNKDSVTITEMCSNSVPVKQIAESIGRDPTVIYAYIKRHGINIKVLKSKLTNKEKIKIIFLHGEGLSTKAI